MKLNTVIVAFVAAGSASAQLTLEDIVRKNFGLEPLERSKSITSITSPTSSTKPTVSTSTILIPSEVLNIPLPIKSDSKLHARDTDPDDTTNEAQDSTSSDDDQTLTMAEAVQNGLFNDEFREQHPTDNVILGEQFLCQQFVDWTVMAEDISDGADQCENDADQSKEQQKACWNFVRKAIYDLEFAQDAADIALDHSNSTLWSRCGPAEEVSECYEKFADAVIESLNDVHKHLSELDQLTQQAITIAVHSLGSSHRSFVEDFSLRMSCNDAYDDIHSKLGQGLKSDPKSGKSASVMGTTQKFDYFSKGQGVFIDSDDENDDFEKRGEGSNDDDDDDDDEFTDYQTINPSEKYVPRSKRAKEEVKFDQETGEVKGPEKKLPPKKFEANFDADGDFWNEQKVEDPDSSDSEDFSDFEDEDEQEIATLVPTPTSTAVPGPQGTHFTREHPKSSVNRLWRAKRAEVKKGKKKEQDKEEDSSDDESSSDHESSDDESDDEYERPRHGRKAVPKGWKDSGKWFQDDDAAADEQIDEFFGPQIGERTCGCSSHTTRDGCPCERDSMEASSNSAVDPRSE